MLAVLSAVTGVLGAIEAVLLFYALGESLSIGAMTVPLPGIFVRGILAFILFLTIPYLITAAALFRFEPWSRTLGIIVFASGMISIPFGTVIGVYGITLLLQPEVDEFFEPRFDR